MSRAELETDMLEMTLELMAELGEPIEVGTYQGGQDPVTGDRVDPTFIPLASPLGVLMPLTEQQRAQLLPTSAGIPDRIPTFVAYLPFRLTPQHKLRLKGKIYDPVTEPADLGGVGAAWEVYLRAAVD